MSKAQRISVGDWDVEDVLAVARITGARLVWRKAHCEHGQPRAAGCTQCRAGYVTDLYPYARVGRMATDSRGRYLVADSHDGDYVVYIPMRDQRKLLAH